MLLQKEKNVRKTKLLYIQRIMKIYPKIRNYHPIHD